VILDAFAMATRIVSAQLELSQNLVRAVTTGLFSENTSETDSTRSLKLKRYRQILISNFQYLKCLQNIVYKVEFKVKFLKVL